MKILIFCILIILATTACDSSSNKIVLNSNYKHDSSNDKPEERPSHNTIYNSYNFQEGILIDISYKLYYKKENTGLIILTHKKNSSLEEWNILLDSLLLLNHNIILYDLRGHGYSDDDDSDTDFSKMENDLISIVNFAKNQHPSSYEHFLFIGNGLGANLSLHSSPKFCNINSSFIILTPKLNETDLLIKNFNKHCESSNYLYLYSKKSFEGIADDKREYTTLNSKNITTKFDEISNELGINLLLHNSNFLSEVKNIISGK